MGLFDWLPGRKKKLALEDKQNKAKAAQEALKDIKRILDLIHSLRNGMEVPTALEEFETLRVEDPTLKKDLYKTYLEFLEVKAKNFLDITHVIEGRLAGSQREIDKIKRELDRISSFEKVLLSGRIDSLKKIVEYEVSEQFRSGLLRELDRIDENVKGISVKAKEILEGFSKQLNAKLGQLERKLGAGEEFDLDQLEKDIESFIAEVVAAKNISEELDTEGESVEKLKVSAKALEDGRNSLIAKSKQVREWLNESRELTLEAAQYVETSVKSFEGLRDEYKKERVQMLAFIKELKKDAKMETQGYYQNIYWRLLSDVKRMERLYGDFIEIDLLNCKKPSDDTENKWWAARDRLLKAKGFGPKSGESWILKSFREKITEDYIVITGLFERKISQSISSDDPVIEERCKMLQEYLGNLRHFYGELSAKCYGLQTSWPSGNDQSQARSKLIEPLENFREFLEGSEKEIFKNLRLKAKK
jgi:hypothetical protein